MVVDKLISRRWAIAWHFILSVIGCSVYDAGIAGIAEMVFGIGKYFLYRCIVVLFHHVQKKPAYRQYCHFLADCLDHSAYFFFQSYLLAMLLTRAFMASQSFFGLPFYMPDLLLLFR